MRPGKVEVDQRGDPLHLRIVVDVAVRGFRILAYRDLQRIAVEVHPELRRDPTLQLVAPQLLQQ
jgi:hypothetical protein